MKYFRATVLAALTLLAVPIGAQEIPPEQAEAIIRDLQNSHIAANVPPREDFGRFLKRDLAAYFRSPQRADYDVQYELLRDGPTQSGVSYPKYYVWVRVTANEIVVREGAVRVAAIARERFEVTHFIERTEFERDRAQLEMVFPAPVVSAIESKVERSAQVPTKASETLAVGDLIARLGTGADRSPVDTIQALHEYGRDAVPKLIEELREVDPDKADSEHEVWCERALRSMTGQVFTFRTNEKLTSRQREFLNPAEPMGYFVEWMSRGRIYVAPKDVQRAVIEAWRKWFAESGETFNLRQFSWEWDGWYF